MHLSLFYRAINAQDWGMSSYFLSLVPYLQAVFLSKPLPPPALCAFSLQFQENSWCKANGWGKDCNALGRNCLPMCFQGCSTERSWFSQGLQVLVQGCRVITTLLLFCTKVERITGIDNENGKSRGAKRGEADWKEGEATKEWCGTRTADRTRRGLQIGQRENETMTQCGKKMNMKNRKTITEVENCRWSKRTMKRFMRERGRERVKGTECIDSWALRKMQMMVFKKSSCAAWN